MSTKKKGAERLAAILGDPEEQGTTVAPCEEKPEGGGGEGTVPTAPPSRSVAGAFMPLRPITAAGESLQARVCTLEAELAAEREGRAGDRARAEQELQRLRSVAEKAGEDVGEFVLLEPGAVVDPLPADRLPGGFTDAAFQELLRDIETNGQNDAITVRRTPEGFEIAAGRRRLEACRRLGIRVLARVRDLDPEAMIRIQFAENERRADISTIERARWFAQVREKYGKQVQELADMFHLDRTTVSLYLRLARLPQAILDRIADPRALSMTKARRLMAEIEQQGEGALRRVIEALDRYDSVVSARGAQPVAEDQVDAAIRAAEGRGLPRILKETGEGPDTERRVIIHRGRRVGTLTRNGGQWIVRLATHLEDRVAIALAERLPEVFEAIEGAEAGQGL